LRDRIKTANGADGTSTITLPQSTVKGTGSEAENTGNRIQNCRGSPLYLESRSSLPTPPASDATLAQRPFSPDKESCYHGPTSDIFDEKSNVTESQYDSGITANLPHVWVERQLIAESASQRQLEIINSMTGALDFDSVDPELAMNLLSLYWNRQHTSTPTVYRTAFMRDMASAGPHFSNCY